MVYASSEAEFESCELEEEQPEWLCRRNDDDDDDDAEHRSSSCSNRRRGFSNASTIHNNPWYWERYEHDDFEDAVPSIIRRVVKEETTLLVV